MTGRCGRKALNLQKRAKIRENSHIILQVAVSHPITLFFMHMCGYLCLIALNNWSLVSPQTHTQLLSFHNGHLSLTTALSL